MGGSGEVSPSLVLEPGLEQTYRERVRGAAVQLGIGATWLSASLVLNQDRSLWSGGD